MMRFEKKTSGVCPAVSHIRVRVLCGACCAKLTKMPTPYIPRFAMCEENIGWVPGERQRGRVRNGSDSGSKCRGQQCNSCNEINKIARTVREIWMKCARAIIYADTRT